MSYPSYNDPQLNILFFILLLPIAGAAAYYAKRKGRNPLFWFVIGVLLGIFSLLILWLLPHVSSNQDQEGEARPTMTVSNPDPSLHHSTSVEIVRPLEEDKLWYYLDQHHQQMGPVSIVALRELWNRGQLDLESYVWAEGMAQWQKVDHLPNLKTVLNVR